MPDKPAVLLDTSTLRGTSLDSAPFRTLLELSKADLVDILIPELVAEERRTQWRDSRADGLRSGREALEALLADPLLTESHKAPVKIALEATNAVDIEQVSKDAYECWMETNRITKVPLSLDQTKHAWASYFSGSQPHRKVKSREDIPDAHIHASACELVSDHSPLHCVTSDKGLGAALEALEGVILHSSIEDLLQAEPFTAARAHWERDQVWQELLHKVSFPNLIQEVRDMIAEAGGDFLEGHSVVDPIIPEDNDTAEIYWASGGELVEVTNPDDWGGGLLSFEVTFECEAGICFPVHRSDAYGLPAWVNVTWGFDPEVHYVDAEGDVRLAVEGVVTAQVDLSTAAGDAPTFSDWTLEPKRISVASTA